MAMNLFIIVVKDSNGVRDTRTVQYYGGIPDEAGLRDAHLIYADESLVEFRYSI